MIYLIPEIGMFTVSLDEAKEFIAVSGSRGLGHPDVEVLVYDMPPAQFIVNHWIVAGELPEPNMKMSLPRHSHH